MNSFARGLSTFRHSPLTGVGLGQIGLSTAPPANSSIIQAAAEMGVVGAIGIALMTVALAVAAADRAEAPGRILAALGGHRQRGGLRGVDSGRGTRGRALCGICGDLRPHVGGMCPNRISSTARRKHTFSPSCPVRSSPEGRGKEARSPPLTTESGPGALRLARIRLGLGSNRSTGDLGRAPGPSWYQPFAASTAPGAPCGAPAGLGPLVASFSPGHYLPVAITDDQGSYLVFPWLSGLLHTTNVETIIKTVFVIAVAALVACYPLIFRRLTGSRLAALASPPVALLFFGFLTDDGFYWVPAVTRGRAAVADDPYPRARRRSAGAPRNRSSRWGHPAISLPNRARPADRRTSGLPPGHNAPPTSAARGRPPPRSLRRFRHGSA